MCKYKAMNNNCFTNSYWMLHIQIERLRHCKQFDKIFKDLCKVMFTLNFLTLFKNQSRLL